MTANELREIRDRFADQFLNNTPAGVTVGIGADAHRKPCLVVMAEHATQLVRVDAPEKFEGLSVRTEVVGEAVAHSAGN